MPDYSQSKIYKIVCHTTGKIYIGSTTQSLQRRLQKHLSCYSSYKNPEVKQGYITSFEILEKGDYDILLICEYPCDTRRELEKKEQEYISEEKCINEINSYGIDTKKHAETQKKHSDIRSKKHYDCECGKRVLISNKARHLKSTYHIKRIS